MRKTMAQPETTYLVDELHVKGKPFTLVGILHDREEFNKNKVDYERLIKPHSALMLEQPLWYPDFSFDQSSFGQIAALAMKMEKKVYIADPFDVRVLAADAAACVGGLALMVKATADLGKNALTKRERELTRKAFILRLGALGLGLPFFFGSLPGMDLRSAIDRDSAYSYGLDDQLTWGSKDWRDLWIAIGINKVFSQVPELYSMVAFHGLGHQRGILHYLTHGEEMKREARYLPFEKISSNLGVREWIPKKKKWELARIF
jgi:hypothetical protein